MIPIALTVLVAFATPVRAQQAAAPVFEVATVRENTSSETRQRIEVLPSGQFNAINMTVREILSIAYPSEGGRFRHENHLVGGPAWLGSTRFDIIAKVEGARGVDTNKPGFAGNAADREAVERVRLMLHHLLAERFKLRLHFETRQLPIYNLVIAKSTGELGPELKKATTDCMEEWKRQGRPEARALACGTIQRARGTGVTAYAVEMGPFVRDLYDWTGRLVVDRTGLTGRFDFTLNFAPDSVNDSDAPSIFTAVQEQLGLKLEPATGPVEVLVIDSAERPTPD